nr:abnormal spindle-like microcephaly-associated protein homolog isoform X1 [Tanacetum cinerariifolium]
MSFDPQMTPIIPKQEFIIDFHQVAANVDDGKRIINRLIASLAELRNMKSASGILYTCATLELFDLLVKCENKIQTRIKIGSRFPL